MASVLNRQAWLREVAVKLFVSFRPDALEWLKSQGKGYQSRLNEILRAAMIEQLRQRQALQI